jgi:hypothetical protein
MMPKLQQSLPDNQQLPASNGKFPVTKETSLLCTWSGRGPVALEGRRHLAAQRGRQGLVDPLDPGAPAGLREALEARLAPADLGNQ